MADLIYVAVIVAFFAVAGLYVVACDRIIGAEDVEVLAPGAAPAPQPEGQRSAA